MGILNLTPDSFSDGGRYFDAEAARRRIDELVSEGADIIDIGAESTRPGALPVTAPEQIARIGGAVREACARGAVVSIDTTLPEVAAHALAEGASVVNSISPEPAAELARVAAAHGAALVLMHSRGSMADMRGFSVWDDDAYGDVVDDVSRELGAAARRAEAAGLDAREILLDPGLGFSKNAHHSLALCARLAELVALGFDVLVGPSRKSFVARAAAAEGEPLAPPGDRLGGTIAAAIACVARGARVVRVHDVAATRQALRVARAIDGAAVRGGGRDATAHREGSAHHA